jgi:integrase
MPKKPPSYRQRFGSDQAIVTLTDSRTGKRRDYWLGEYDSPVSREMYHRVIADWEARNRRHPPAPPPPPVSRSDPDGIDRGAVTVSEICLAFWRHATSYYEPTAATHFRGLIRITRQLFGSLPARSFGPNCLRRVRDQMVSGDPAPETPGMPGTPGTTPPRKPWSRPYINSQVHRLCRMFKWAASHEMIPASVYHELKTVPALRRGRTPARDPDPVKPVPIECVDAVRPFLSRQVAALVDLQLLTGARGGELFKLRGIDIQIDDRKGVWTIAPAMHKTAHFGHRRTIYLGPKAQKVIRPFLVDRPLDAYLFSPADAERERREALSKARVTPRSCGNVPGSNRVSRPTKKPGDHYTANSYCRAIAYACDRAMPPPEHLRPLVAAGPGDKYETWKDFHRRLTPQMREETRAWRRDHRWHPHQLRHTAATQIRHKFGLEAARIALGHSSALITDAVYAERDMDHVVEVMKSIG